MQLFTFAADHGVTEEGVSPYPAEVTRQMALNMASGGAAVSVMCRHAGIDYAIVDMGIGSAPPESSGIIDRRVAPGTRNFAKEAAMSREECLRAIQAGFELARECGADLVGIGEMGIGNSASASALYSLLLGLDPSETVGPGAGASGELLEHKRRVVMQAVAYHQSHWDHTPLDALRRLGGFEIAGMVGAIIGCAHAGVGAVADGFISSAAALAAMRMRPEIRDYLYFSHVSAERFHAEFLASEAVTPILNLSMRLGEGTGSALAMQVIAQALACYAQMATFSDAGISGATTHS
jgi:nicotinate-nucleotide--dimethylbenzimidazole phosphoribosyltransferase